MKCKIPEISWHNRDPVLCVDVQPKTNKNFYRLASGGTDSHVLIWYLNLTSDGSDIVLELASDLTRHQRAVNVVKWSPNGELLASGDDESVIFIWKQKEENEPINIVENTNDQDKEVWITLKILRGHMEDVYDLSWAPNSQLLLSGSVDNSAMIWDVHKGKSLGILNDHKGFVQGVAWDPKNQYLATLSTDRFLRIFDLQTKRVVHRVNKGPYPLPKDHDLHEKQIRYFHDDTLQTFFRRLCFTPDGTLLLTPAGVADYDGVVRPFNTTYAFSRFSFKQPSLVLSNPDQYTIVVRCCPLLFNLRPHDPEKNPPVVQLPYRMVFAVATKSSVIFYDTQQKQPFGIISNIHYTRLTDLTWSLDGRIVIVSSTDGFCSLITFEPNELGEIYDRPLHEILAQDVSTVINKKSRKQKENETQNQKTKLSVMVLNSHGDIQRKPLKDKVVKRGNDNEEEAVSTNIANEKLLLAPDVTSTDNSSDFLSDRDSNIPSEVAKIKSLHIIIDKEILSSDEKFDSPEKKAQPTIPITYRRTPRTPASTKQTSVDSENTSIKSQATELIMEAKKPIDSPSTSQKSTTQIEKRAKPIAIRRKTNIMAPIVIEKPTLEEEAMDAWPLKDEKTIKSTVNVDESKEVALPDQTTFERTEDMRLVYEDSNSKTDTKIIVPPQKQQRTITAKNHGKVEMTSNVENTLHEAIDAQKQNEHTPTSKTPRRVALRTISTPKSKKKLIN